MVSASLILLMASTSTLGANSSGETVLLEFSAPWCGPCQQVKPVVAKLVADGYPIRQINLDQNRALATRYGVIGIPCFVAIKNGKVVRKVSGYHSYQQLQQLMKIAGITKPADRVVNARAQSPDSRTVRPKTLPKTYASTQKWDQTNTTTNTASRNKNHPLNNARVVNQNNPSINDRFNHVFNNNNTNNQRSSKTAIKQKILNATVRLKIEAPDGSWYDNGTGTIIDTHGNEALILTCGHLFTESKGKGKITVDTFGQNSRKGLKAKLLSYDHKREVGLVTVSSDQPFQAIAMAGVNFQPRKGDPIIHIGCNHGNDPTIGESVISNINPYLGPGNLTVKGTPVQGRSGGGLFNTQGEFIGICFAADVKYKEGLFATLSPIRKELDRANLAFVYKKIGSDSDQQNQNSQIAKTLENFSGGNTNIARVASNQQLTGEKNSAAAAILSSQQLSSQQRAALALAANSEHAEVICIIRSLKDPRAKSEVLVLDRASPEFLKQLHREKQIQTERFETKHTVKRNTNRIIPKNSTTNKNRSSAGWYSTSQ